MKNLTTKEALYTTSKIIELAKEEYEITNGRIKKDRYEQISDIDKAMRTQIERTLKNQKNGAGTSYWDEAFLDKERRPTGEKKFTRFFQERTVKWLLEDVLKDYFCNQSDCEKIRAGLTKRNEYKKKARDIEKATRQYLETEDRPYGVPEEYENLNGSPDFKLTGYDADKIYRHMIEKIFEQFYTPFDFELYTNDWYACDVFDGLVVDPELLEAKERYAKLENYYKKRMQDNAESEPRANKPSYKPKSPIEDLQKA